MEDFLNFAVSNIQICVLKMQSKIVYLLREWHICIIKHKISENW